MKQGGCGPNGKTKSPSVNQEWYLDSLESAPFGILIHDSRGKILFYNTFLESLTGYGRDEIPDIQTWIKKVYPGRGYREVILSERKKARSADELRIRESMVTTKDGLIHPCRFSSKTSATGIRTVLIQTVGGDWEAVTSAIEGYENLQNQFQITPTPLLAWISRKNDFIMSSFNKATAALTSGEIAKYLGKSVGDIFDSHEQIADCMKQCITEKKAVECSQHCYLPGADPEFAFDCTFLFLPPEFIIMHISTRTEFIRTKENLRESKRSFRDLVNMLPITIFETDTDGKLTFCNRNGLDRFEYTLADIENGLYSRDFLSEEDKFRALANMKRVLNGEVIGVNEYTAVTKSGKKVPVLLRSAQILKGEKVVGLRGFSVDVSEQKKAEIALKKAYAEMETKVAERTMELEAKTKELLEVNTALRVLLRDQHTHKDELKEHIQINATQLIIPHLAKLQKSQLTRRQRNWLRQAVTNLENITSPLGGTISTYFEKLTPSELQVADLIKNGKSTKEIADILDLAIRTIESHRKNIRSKLGLRNQKVNLRTYLLSL